MRKTALSKSNISQTDRNTSSKQEIKESERKYFRLLENYGDSLLWQYCHNARVPGIRTNIWTGEEQVTNAGQLGVYYRIASLPYKPTFQR